VSILYWLCITNRENWEIIKKHNIWGVSERHKNMITQVKKGDKLIFYIKQKIYSKNKHPSVIAGIYEAISESYRDETEIFEGRTYPWRVKIKPVRLGEINFKDLIPKLSFIKNKKRWSGHLMGRAMIKIPEEDYRIIESMLK